MTDERKSEITRVLAQKGALGVNALAREIGLNVSTLQKYLHNQSYFRINESKKWDLPERVTSDLRVNQLESLATVTEASITLVRSNIEELLINVDNALAPLKILKRDIGRIPPSVANSGTINLHPAISSLLENVAKYPEILKSKKDALSQENYELLQNVDWIPLILDMGRDFMTEVIDPEVYRLILGETTELSEDALIPLKKYQKS